MRPIPIAEYLDRISRPLEENVAPSPPATAEVSAARRSNLSPFPIRQLKPTTERSEHRLAMSTLRSARAEAAERPSDLEIEARIAEAVERGREQGRTEALAQAEEMMAEERRIRDEQAILSRLEFQLGECAKLGDELASAVAAVEHRISGAVARILAPILEQARLEQVLTALVDSVTKLRVGSAPKFIQVRGPKEILERLAERSADVGVEVRFCERATIEVSVEADDTMIETHLAGWKDSLFAAYDRGEHVAKST